MEKNKKKLEILVVEDNLEYIKVAKNYFNGVQDINVDYAMDRTNALLKLESKKYDGVITDRSMPADEGKPLKFNEKLTSSETQENNEIFRLKDYDGLQGDIVAHVAVLIKKIPTLIHSYHGDSTSFQFLNERGWGIKTEDVADIIKKYSVTFEKFLEGSLFEPTLPDFTYNKHWITSDIMSRPKVGSEGKYARKSDPESWAHALTLLRERMD